MDWTATATATATNPQICIANRLPKRSSKRLLFDRRYGWVFDEWKEPSEEALAGGRGMFCILPLAKAFFNTASQSINHAANFAVKVSKSPECLSPQALQARLNNQLSDFKSSIQKPEFNFLALMGNSPSQTPTFPSNLQFETRDSQMA